MFVYHPERSRDRMAAKEGTKDYGILSILMAATGEVKPYSGTLKPNRLLAAAAGQFRFYILRPRP